MITIKVGLFAVVKELIGKSELSLELPEGTTGKGLLMYLIQNYPVAGGILEKSVLAKGENYFPLNDELQHQDIIAVIPPVSGGTR
jgi:molybdopterin synthase sulfur carrier subunit